MKDIDPAPVRAGSFKLKMYAFFWTASMPEAYMALLM